MIVFFLIFDGKAIVLLLCLVGWYDWTTHKGKITNTWFIPFLLVWHAFEIHSTENLPFDFDILKYTKIRALIVTKGEVVASSLDSEIKSEVKEEMATEKEAIKGSKQGAEPSIVLKPKQEMNVKSATQIVKEERGKWVALVLICNSVDCNIKFALKKLWSWKENDPY